MWNLLAPRGRHLSPSLAAVLMAAAGAVGAQSTPAVAGGTSPASVELLCRLEMPALCAVRDVQQVSVRQLGGGLHEVAFDVIVAANTRWTLTVKSRPSTSAAPLPDIEVRNEAGNWVPVQPEREPVTIASARASANRHSERVVFRIRAPDHLAALQLVQFEVVPTAPQ